MAKSFGERSHKGRAVLKSIHRAEARGQSTSSRKLSLRVFVGRYAHVTDSGRKGRFWAKVCPMSAAAKWRKSDKPRNSRCGPEGYGTTPTRAVESALVALARSHNLRK
jgi:hypothetical protein